MAETLRTPGRPRPERAGRADARVPRRAGARRAGPSRIELPGTAEPDRWIGAEEAGALRVGLRPGDRPTDDGALETIVRRYLRTHALVGLDDLTARYPIGPALATDLLERWPTRGRWSGSTRSRRRTTPRWADRRNLDEVRRLSIALRRRESVAVAPEVFADFVARRQDVHPRPAAKGRRPSAWSWNSSRGSPRRPTSGSRRSCPRRVRDYRPAWLDEALGSGDWTWRAEADGRGEPRVAFVPRDFAGRLAGRARSVAELDRSRAARSSTTSTDAGRSFATDLARETGPGAVARSGRRSTTCCGAGW